MAVKKLEVPLVGEVFLYELGKRKISYTNIAVDDLQEELGKIGEGAHACG